MKAAIISLGSQSSRWTRDEMTKLFSHVDDIRIKDLFVYLKEKDPMVLYNSKPLAHYDCVLAKGSFRFSPLLASITTIIREGTYMPLESTTFMVGHNKLLTHLCLVEHGVPMPSTYLASTVDSARKLLKKMTFPIIMKFPEGTQGKGVMYAESFGSASSILDALTALRQPFLIQEYIETGGRDIRAIVVGDRVVAAMERKAEIGETRANIHAGGTGKKIIITAELQRIAVKSARAVKAEICAVDILMSHKGPVVIEVNISPGLQGITAATSINVAKYIAEHLFKRTKEFKNGGKKKSSEEILDDLGMSKPTVNEVITNLTFRGDTIILPSVATRLSGFKEEDEFIIKTEKKRITIEKI
ncbi:TPA: RimK family alpha-L-glutamate ligase [Candidatus Woesearchaeota archaeon]|nr:RimK family alpha-L-glutamate ligase [Candidatus Woesearchaeota archaeon]HIH49015.1 RimK family alpha-L-glutamate ligase [Candidatus Woesearchaeota archaeon]HIJ03020.1 RimK family alpha-L-glutamate ligase [Candidatus Woesearchaeota archaeon]